MEKRRKLWVSLALTCCFLGAGIWMLAPSKASSKASSSVSSTSPRSASPNITLQVSGRHQQLLFEDAEDLPENSESIEALNGISRPIALARGDVNNDAIPDLLAAYATNGVGELRVRLGTPVGELGLPRSYVLDAANPKSIVLGDFNVDGLKDAAVANSEAGTISLLYGTENGFIAGPTMKLGGNLTQLAVGDFNRDSLDDLAVIDEAAGKARLILGQGDLSAAQAKDVNHSALGQVAGLKAADFNSDFYLDLAVAGDSGISVVYGNGKGEFGSERKLSHSGSVTGIAVADFDGDLLPDIAVSTPGAITVWNDRLDKGFSKAKRFDAGAGSRGLIDGDFNRDGLADFAVINDGNKVSVLLNKKGAGFSEPLDMDTDSDPISLASGDFRLNRNDAIAISKSSGRIVMAIVPLVVTVNVSTLMDENDCASCTTAQLLALRDSVSNPQTPIGGGTGISIREALTAINNDALLLNPPKVNQGVGFNGLNSNPPVNSTTDLLDTLTPVPNNPTLNYWLVTVGSPLPAFLAVGTSIEGQVVKGSGTAGGPNNNIGPKVVISGSGVNITSSASNSLVRNIGVINPGGAVMTVNGRIRPQQMGATSVIVSGNNCMVTQCNIGLDADSVTPGAPGGIGILVTGVSNTMITNNIISGNGGDGVQINGIGQSINSSQNNIVDNNRIGLDRLGMSPMGTGNGGNGVLVMNAATGNIVRNNFISGNALFGVNVAGNITSNTTITNNRVGTDPSGQLARPNGMDGVGISTVGNSKFNTASQNLISGNTGSGLSISSGDVQAQFNVVANNKIGINSTGSVQLPNGMAGALITGSSNGNTIGGSSRATFNQISGNTMSGIVLGSLAMMVPANNRIAPQQAIINPNNNLVRFNDIGANNLGTAAPFDPANPGAAQPQSNKMGGVMINGASFSNEVSFNNVAFNAEVAATISGIAHSATGNFNSFLSNNVFLNPPDMAPTVPQISVSAGNQGILDAQVTLVDDPATPPTLLKINSAVTTTSTGLTTVKGTANFLDQTMMGPITANINLSTIQLYVSKRGSETTQAMSEAQVFLNAVLSFQPSSLNPDTLDWSASLTIPAPFLNPTQTNTVFLTATITTGDGSTSPLSIGKVPQFVSGGGGQCALAVSPTSVSFANAAPGQPVTQTITLTNNGGTPISLSSAAFNPINSAFSVTGATFPLLLNASQTQTLTVTFTPAGNANVTTSLVVSNSCNGTLTIPITGNGCIGTLASNPTTLNFNNVTSGTSTSQTVTISNVGCAAASLPFTVSLSGDSASAFSATVSGAVVTVTVNPVTLGTGTITGTLIITSQGASNSPITIPLTATIVALPVAVISVSPLTIDFGNVAVGQQANQTVTIRNVGNATLALTTPVVVSGSNAGFTVTAPPALSLGAGAATTAQVSFRPTQSGQTSGQVQFSSTNGGAVTVTLLGTGASAGITLITSNINFGNVTVGQTSTMNASFSSIGNATLTLSALAISGGGANGFNLLTQAPLSVAPGNTGSIALTFTPSSAGAKSDTLIITTNDPGNPTVRVNLTGSGADNVPPVVSVQAPVGGLAVAGGTQFQVRFTASDNVALGSFEVLLSTGGGFNQSLGTGAAVNGTNTFTAVAPTGIETTTAAVQVNVRDSNGNTGSATSSLFVIGTPPSIIGADIVDGKFRTFASGSNIQPGAVLVVGNDTFGLGLSGSGRKFIVRKNSVGSGGRRLRDLAPRGTNVTVVIRNPNGISSSPASIVAQ